MGIKHSEGKGNLVFLDIDQKAGVFKQGKEHLDPGTSVEGILKKFTVKPESFPYNGQTIHKETLSLRMADTDPSQPDIVVSITLSSGGDGDQVPGDANYQALRLLGKLNAANLGAPIEIKPWSVQKGQTFAGGVAERDMMGVAVKQDGKSLKEDYGNGLTELPEREVVKGANGKPVLVGGKEVKDSGPWNTLLDQLLDSLHGRLPAMAEKAAAQTEAELDVDPAEIAGASQAATEAAATAAATAAANRPAMRTRA